MKVWFSQKLRPTRLAIFPSRNGAEAATAAIKQTAMRHSDMFSGISILMLSDEDNRMYIIYLKLGFRYSVLRILLLNIAIARISLSSFDWSVACIASCSPRIISTFASLSYPREATASIWTSLKTLFTSDFGLIGNKGRSVVWIPDSSKAFSCCKCCSKMRASGTISPFYLFRYSGRSITSRIRKFVSPPFCYESLTR